ncbi:MAG: hypothetical protein KF718_15445 [Polyangiaceae bacterium]|nr:hypothetical protein [Polyangiaceae bacterium]
MNEPKNEVTRRSALGALLGGATLVACGGAQEGQTPATGGLGAGGAGAGGGGGSLGGGAGQSGGGGTGGALSCGPGRTPGCLVTDDNILGPFYKADAPFRTDLTDGKVGDRLLLEGVVYGCDCVTPLAGAIVDVWQADAAGAYDNVGFVLRGRAQTDASGRYEFASILPGFYLNGAQYRPRHVHYRVSHPSSASLTTQLYFEGDPYIPIDPFVRQSLVKPLVAESDQAGQLVRCTFDIVLG